MPDRVEPVADAALADIYRQVGLEPPTLTRADVNALTGVPRERSIRWWRAMGLPEIGDDEIAFRPADVDIVQRNRQLIASGLVDEDDILRLARVMGASFSRLVDAQLDVIQGLATPDGAPPGDHALDPGVVDLLSDAMNYVWRRHLIAALGQRAAVEHADDGIQAVGFVDLSGFTRVSRSADADEIARIIETFEVAAFDIVSSCNGRVVKMIGDEAMFVAPTIADAITIQVALIDRLGSADFMPKVHCGLAWGPTLTIGGDVFGNTVNLASRLTKIARPGTIAAPRTVADQLAERDDVDVRPVRRPYDLKGLGRTTIVVIRPRRERSRPESDAN